MVFDDSKLVNILAVGSDIGFGGIMVVVCYRVVIRYSFCLL